MMRRIAGLEIPSRHCLLLAAALALALSGCTPKPEEHSDSIKSADVKNVSITEAQTLDGFQRHWTVGTMSAWMNAKRHEVIVVNEAEHTLLKVSDLPREYGSIVATGWEKDRDFFVHFSKATDSGTMVYIDLKTATIVRVKEWGAF
jgi:hypothetical protein